MMQVIQTAKAPGPSQSAPYSQAVVSCGLVFLAGQLPIDPLTGELVPGGIEAETEQALRNMSHVLEAAGSSLDKLVKINVYLRAREDWAAMNDVFRKILNEPFPARCVTEVGRLGFDALIELDAVAERIIT